MKIEFELSEEEIKLAAKGAAEKAVGDFVRRWMTYDDITARLKHLWTAEIDRQIAEALENSDDLKEKINTAIERKLKARIEVLFRKTDK